MILFGTKQNIADLLRDLPEPPETLMRDVEARLAKSPELIDLSRVLYGVEVGVSHKMPVTQQ